MNKDGFVTDNLHRISSHIAEARLKNSAMHEEAAVPADPAGSEASPKKNIGGKIGLETERALCRRHEEFLRLRGDILAHLTEAQADAAASSVRSRRSADEFHAAEQKLSDFLKTVEEIQEPDPQSPDYQVRLAEACRSLEMIRLGMIRTKGALEHPVSGNGMQEKELNLFSEMASISFSQLLRIGFAIGLPFLIALLLGSAVIAAAVILTFRMGI